MAPTDDLTALGQSIWLDDIRRDYLDDGTLQAMIDDLGVTGLTSNPSIFDEAIAGTQLYDDAIAELAQSHDDVEEVFFALATQDLQRAADLFRPIWDDTDGRDGCVSLEVSPHLADETQATIEQAAKLHAQVDRANLMIKIPGTEAGLPAIKRSIADGVPINVTLLFSVDQYRAAADAWLQGLEERHDAGEPLGHVASVASIFVSRWDVPANEQLPERLHDRLGIAVARQAYAGYRDLLESERWQRLAAAGATPQRLLFGSTSVKTDSRDTLYVEELAAPDTVNTMPRSTLEALADHGRIEGPMPADGGDATATLTEIEAEGVDVAALAVRLQEEGKQKFADSWDSLMDSLRDQMR